MIKVIGLILIMLVAMTLYVAILVAPGKATPEMKAPFMHRYFAHRGLHTKDNSIPENTVAAFEAACNAGYGMELDVRLTADKEVIVIHDPNLMRPCGVDLDVKDLTYNEILEYGLFGTEFRVPLLTDVLECVDGRAPIIVEIKPMNDVTIELAQRTMAILAPYEGEYCVESFDPGVVKWLRYNAPHILRGQLSNQFKDFEKTGSALVRYIVSRCLLNMMGRPHFIAYKTGRRPLSVKLARMIGAMQIAWTSHPEDMGGTPEKDKRENDSVIFEFYEPPTTY